MIISRKISVTHGVSGSGEGMRAIIHEQATAGRNASDLPIWIPCSAQLPKEENTYLCTYAASTGHLTGVCDYDIADGIGWCFWSDALKSWEPVKNVIAWMPLPAPFEDKGSAEPERDEWCSDCKEYDSEKHCCPRFNRVIRQTVEQLKVVCCKDCIHDNACAIQDAAQTGGWFYCGYGERGKKNG